MNPTTILVTALLALGMTLLITPIVRHLAVRWGLVDQPDNHRKLQKQAIPLGGGICILLGVFLAQWLDFVLGRAGELLTEDTRLMSVGLWLAMVAIVALGCVDDRFGLRGRHKLFGQIAVAVFLVTCGYQISAIQVFGLRFELGIMSVPVTVGWLVLAANALNLIDGVDGLATTVGIILSCTLAGISFLLGRGPETITLAALAGALIGFLRFNFPPARMYLGDAGSMLIGLVLGAVSISGSLKGPTVVGFAAPLAVWTVPLLDTFAAIVRRKLTGRSIYAADRSHLHHCLYQISGSARRTLYLIVLACAATCIGALSSVWLKSDVFALMSALSVVSVLVATRSFGYGEMQLITARLRSVVRGFVPQRMAGTPQPRQQIVRFQGSRPWEDLWEALLALTEELQLSQLSLDVNIPSIHENYHVSWIRPSAHDPPPQWVTELPLCTTGHHWGCIRLAGPHDGFSACLMLAKLMDLLRPFEAHFQDAISVGGSIPLAATHETQPAAVRRSNTSEEPELSPSAMPDPFVSRPEILISQR